MTDLSEFQALQDSLNQAIDVPVLHPVTGAELGVTIKVVSYQSRIGRERVMGIIGKWRAKARNGKLTLEQETVQSREILAAMIVGWEGLEENKKPVEYSQAKALEIVRDYQVIADAVDAAVGDREAFFSK